MATDLLQVAGCSTDSVLPEFKRRIDLVGLADDVLDRYPFELSGGMRQRVTIILSTLLNPSLLIADEVTSALDVSTQRAVGEMLIEFRERGFVKSMIVITHDLSILAQIADTILVMYAGKLAEKAERRDHRQRSAPSLHPDAAGLAARGRGAATTRAAWSASRAARLRCSTPARLPVQDRCPFAFENCAEEPPFVEVQAGHQVACWKVSQEVAPKPVAEPGGQA